MLSIKWMLSGIFALLIGMLCMLSLIHIWEAVAEMVRKGDVRAADGVFKAAMPVFTQAQYGRADALAQRFACLLYTSRCV